MLPIIVFFFIALLLGQLYLSRKAGNAPAQPPAQQPPAATAPVQAPAASTTPAATPTVPVRKAEGESAIVVENAVFRVTFTNRGAVAQSWVLKNYNDEKGHPLELVNQAAAERYGYPLSLWNWDPALRDRLNSALYVAEGPVPGAQGQRILSFDYAEGDLVVKKTFTFDDSYVVKVKTSVQRGSQYLTALPAWPSGFGDAILPPSYATQRMDYEAGGDIKSLKPDHKGADISGGRVTQRNMQWAGSSDQYFAAIWLPEDPQRAAMAELRNPLEVPKDPAKPQGDKTPLDVLGTAVGTLNAPSSVSLFVGPKAQEILQAVHSASGGDLHGILDFGMFSIIARPLFVWAHWTQAHYVPNWGWTIIVLTVVINVVLLPLRVMGMRSALKMQKVQPQIKAIQEKLKQYKLTDPRRGPAQQEANQQIQALYKEHRVNPAGGCLPMIIQMPFLFAFWSMLNNAFELRQAQWFWLHDLSQPDHYMVLPILIIVSMLVLQRMTPTAGMDPQQQRMMNIMMPLVFGFMSWSLASGLGLYWITGTLVMLVQQWVMNRTALGQEMRAIAEKRARKQTGKGKQR